KHFHLSGGCLDARELGPNGFSSVGGRLSRSKSNSVFSPERRERLCIVSLACGNVPPAQFFDTPQSRPVILEDGHRVVLSGDARSLRIARRRFLAPLRPLWRGSAEANFRGSPSLWLPCGSTHRRAPRPRRHAAQSSNRAASLTVYLGAAHAQG